MINKKIFTIILILVLSNCSVGVKNVTLPEIDSVSPEYCSKDGKIKDVAGYIEGVTDGKSWEEVQGELIKENSEDSNQVSIRLQKARALIASCAVVLYGAVPTGSARDLNDINTKNALKDIDMSVPVDSSDKANKWLRNLIKDPDRTMLLALLMNPIDALPCRDFKGKELTDCGVKNTLETTQLMLLREWENAGKTIDETHFAKKEDILSMCPRGYNLPDKESVNQILDLDSEEKLNDYVKDLPDTMSAKNNFSSKKRIYFLYTALHNPAYYIQSESIRRWVIQREDGFNKELSSRYPAYASGKGIRDIEEEGAVFEQYLQAVRHGESFYYRFKYLFRAMDHVDFDIEKKTPELAAFHRLLKKTRPDTLEKSYEQLKNMISAEVGNNEKALIKYKNNFSYSEFRKVVEDSERAQIDALKKFYQERRKDPNSIWPKVCKE